MPEQKTNIKNLGELKDSGWISKSVKNEIRDNLILKLKAGEQVFEGIFGYDKTVIPQIIHAVLAGHDILLLGLRGQAKTRILRLIPQLLDEYLPIIQDSPLNEDPFGPITKQGREMLADMKEDMPIQWISRQERYAEKLATPDTTVADLIGDIDPIKAATHKLSLADEEVINFGLIPRANRGIFVINELPDLQPRIQVALLNIMQERDVSIRGFNLRIPLDVAVYFSANPEDYTNRGNIITPLKDRIDAQIITHYPKSLEVGMEITRQELRSGHQRLVDVSIPHFIREIIEQIAFEARNSEYIDQKSGVSARLTITAMEQALASAERRALINGDKQTSIRISDLYHTVPALTGKLELVYEGEQEGADEVARHLIGKAVNHIFAMYFPKPGAGKKKGGSDPYAEITGWFNDGNNIILPDSISDREYEKRLNTVKGLKQLTGSVTISGAEGSMAPLMDLVLEGLHQNSVLSKDDLDDERLYRDMVGSVLGSLNFDDDLDDLS